MSEVMEKKEMILKYEEKFAAILASHVIDKPRLSLWMILIPIFFVYYFYELQKFSNGRKMFTEHYLVGKKRALDEAVEVISAGREPHVHTLAKLSDVPETARKEQAEVITVLIHHYTTLLTSHGEDYSLLVRTAYGNLTNYLLFLNRLNQVEKEVNKVLKPHLKKTHDGIDDIVSKIERESERIRREIAEDIFR